MSKKKEQEEQYYCLNCEALYPKDSFYNSYNSTHKGGVLPYCKDCLDELLDKDDLEKTKLSLEEMNKPYIHRYWEKAIQGKSRPVGVYMRTLNLKQNRYKTWADSEFEGEDQEIDKKKTNSKEGFLSEEEFERLQDVWGYGFNEEEVHAFEKRYKTLVNSIPNNTPMHLEALRAYCVYKVKSEFAMAKGQLRDAEKLVAMAQRQGEIAKINPNKLSDSDLSHGLDNFSELARRVEKELDIIPILPRFVARPHDEVDVGIHSFVNYERRLNGLPDVNHAEIYDFYQENLRTYLNDRTKNSKIKEYIKEIEIDVDVKEGTIKKKILFYDVYELIEQKKKENPHDTFIQNLDKWMEFVSWSRLTK